MSWEIDLGQRTPEAVRYAKAIRMVRHYVERFDPDLVAVEAPVGGPKTSHLLVGLWACVAGELHNTNRAVLKCNIQAVRKHFLGENLTTRSFPGLHPAAAKKQIKRAVINRCAALGWPAATDNCADACAIWDFACATNHPTHHTTTIGGLFTNGSEPTP